MKLKINTTKTYTHCEEGGRTQQHIGGTRSGKTWGILHWLIVQGLRTKLNITIVRRSVPALKRSVMKDFVDILQELELYQEDKMNLTDRQYTIQQTGTLIRFINADDEQKLRGLKTDILFIDEANEITEDSYFQLYMRTSGKILLAYNPTVSPYHWLRKMEDCDRYVTTWRDNPFLEQSIIDAIERLQHTQPKLYKIYGLGEYTTNDKAVFTFTLVDTKPEEAELVGYGLDFGFSNDPTAIAEVWKSGDNLYLEQRLYETGLTSTALAAKMKSLGVLNEVYADSSDPRLIRELQLSGLDVRQAKKGKGSIQYGISILHNYKLHILRTSQDMVNEFYSYEWKQDGNNHVTDQPSKGLDHLIDAVRYLALMRLGSGQRKGNYAINLPGLPKRRQTKQQKYG